jgi:hypothetical protein
LSAEAVASWRLNLTGISKTPSLLEEREREWTRGKERADARQEGVGSDMHQQHAHHHSKVLG